MNKKALLSSLLSISLLGSLIVGGTYAAFTKEANSNINVESANVSINSTIENLRTYSINVEQTPGLFENGGRAYIDNGNINIDAMSPGDKVTFDISVTNNSTIKVRYRVKTFINGELKDALIVNIDDPDWAPLEIGEQPSIIHASVELPFEASNDYLNKNSVISITVEAIQYNGLHTVEFYSEDGNTLLYTDFVKDGENAQFVGELPEKEDYIFLGWDRDITNVKSDVVTRAMYQLDDDRLTFTLNGDGESYSVSIHNYLHQSTYIELPETYNGFPVTRLDQSSKYYEAQEMNYGSEGLEYITELIIPDSVTEIAEGTLQSFTSLQNLRLSNNIKKLYYNEIISLENIDSFNFPNNLEEIVGLEYTFDYTMYRHFDSLDYPFAKYEGGLYIGSENNPYFMLVHIENEEGTDAKVHPNTKIIMAEEMSMDRYHNGNLILNDELINLSAFAVQSYNVDDFVIPQSVKYIGAYGLYEYTNESNFTFEENSKLEKLHYYFAGTRSNINSIVVPDTLKIIDTKLCSSKKVGKTDLYNLTYTELNGAKYIPSETNPYHILADVSGVSDLSTFEMHEDTKILWPYVFENASVDTISLPEGLVSISGFAFYNSNIEHIDIPSSVEYIGDNAFSNSTSLGEVNFSSISSYNLRSNNSNEKELVIDDYAFKNCGISNINIPSRVKKINRLAFTTCSNLSSITFDEGCYIEYLGEGIFKDCKALVNVNITSALPYISTQMFQGCSALESINYAEDKRVSFIGKSAFYGCTSLKEIMIPNTVLEVRCAAYEGCSSTTKVYFEENSICEYLREYCFSYCNSDEFIMPNSIKHVEACVIPGEISEIILSDNLEYVASYNFGFADHIDTLTNVWEYGYYIPSHSNPYFAYLYPVIEYDEETWDAYYPPYYVINEDTRIISDSAFYSLPIESITIPESVICILETAFGGMEYLEEIVLPSNIKYLDNAAFAYNTNLKTVDFSKVTNLKTISTNCFAECYSLENIVLPSQIIAIGDGAFGYCTNLKSIDLSDNIESIGSYAFSSTGLSTIELPKSLRYIGECAFDGTQIEEVTIVSDLSGYLNVKKIVVEEGAKYVPLGYVDQIETLIINGYMKYIHYDYSSLKHLEINGKVATLDLCGGSTIETLVINGEVSYIAYDCFGNAQYVREVVINSDIKTIEWNSFINSSITSLVINGNVGSINTAAFENCTSLTSVTINGNVGNIGDAFNNCTNLTTFTVTGTVDALNSNAFEGCTSLESISINGEEQ